MITLGVSPQVVAAIVQRRHAKPLRDIAELAPFAQVGGPGIARLTIGGGTIFTIRSTGRLRLPDGNYSDLTRTVSGVVKLHRTAHYPPIETLRWYDKN